jgi:two-component system sensor histidine kinase YesM
MNVYIPLRYKLLFSYIVLILIPVIVIGSYTYHKTASSAEEEMRNNLNMALSQYGTQVQYVINDIVRSSDALFDDQALSRYLSGYYLDRERHRIMTEYVLPKLESAILLPNIEVMTSLYLNKPTIGEYYYEEREEYLREGYRLYGIMYTDRIMEQEWYKELSLSYSQLIWKQVNNDSEYDNISLLRPLIDYQTFHEIGLLKTTVKLRDIFERIDLSYLAEGAMLVVIDQEQQFVYSHDMTREQYQQSLGTREREFWLMTKELEQMPIHVQVFVPRQEIKKGSVQVRNITIFICFVSLVVAVVISLIISQFFTRRISKLVNSLQAFSEGDFSKRIHYRGNDEFRAISRAFNEMASTSQTQIDEIYVANLEKKEAELQILHAQINPHFLYNTFSSISRMAKLGDVENVHAMIMKLAKFYRLTLNKGEMIIPISKELEIIEAYLDIQNLKYGDRILVSFEVDEQLLGQSTVKFILQPFIENVLEHAWYDEQIQIGITVMRVGNTVQFQIKDNGLGMNEETIKGVFMHGEQAIGYGIRNVNQRIQLHYGMEYGVSITSQVGQGTIVGIVIPYTH